MFIKFLFYVILLSIYFMSLPSRVLVYKLTTLTADFLDAGNLPPGSKHWAKHTRS